MPDQGDSARRTVPKSRLRQGYNHSMPDGTSPPQRWLGAYLLALCAYQIGIYQWPGGPPFILDPRAGIPVLLIRHSLFDNKIMYPVEWSTASWLLLLACVIFFRGALLKTYVISEIVLAAPTAYYIAMLAMAHGGHFAPGFKDLVLTVVLFLFFSVLPVGWAIWSLRRRKTAPA